MTKTRQRILDQVAKYDGTTSVGLLAGDLGLSIKTVRGHVAALISDNRIEIGWDGNQLQLTISELSDRRLGVQAVAA